MTTNPTSAPAAARPTPGWKANPTRTFEHGFFKSWVHDGNQRIAMVYGEDIADLEHRQDLIAEAGTVLHESGRTPRQLLEERDGLAMALENMVNSGNAVAADLNSVSLAYSVKGLLMDIEHARAALARLGKERA